MISDATELSDTTDVNGFVCYDANCHFCTTWARRCDRLLRSRGFRAVPLQSPGIADQLGVAPERLLTQMYLFTADGRRFGGADAVVEFARQIWWARPLAMIAKLPGVMPCVRRLYRWIAGHRYCLGGTCSVPPKRKKRVFFEMP